MLIQADVENHEQVQQLSAAIRDYIQEQKGEILSESIIGASVGDFIKDSAKTAIIA